MHFYSTDRCINVNGPKIVSKVYYSKKYCVFFKLVTLLLFIAQEIKTAQVIKYHQKKALFVRGEKKDANFVWEPCRTTVQLSVKATQCRIAKTGRVLYLHFGPGLKWLTGAAIQPAPS